MWAQVFFSGRTKFGDTTIKNEYEYQTYTFKKNEPNVKTCNGTHEIILKSGKIVIVHYLVSSGPRLLSNATFSLVKTCIKEGIEENCSIIFSAFLSIPEKNV